MGECRSASAAVWLTLRASTLLSNALNVPYANICSCFDCTWALDIIPSVLNSHIKVSHSSCYESQMNQITAVVQVIWDGCVLTWNNLLKMGLNLSALGLRVPPSCELVVGGEPQCWSEGSCLLFDDSFLHRAFHEGKKEFKSYKL